MKRMIAKYPGTCRVCGRKFGGGTPVVWYGKGQLEHDTGECHPASDSSEPEEWERDMGSQHPEELQAQRDEAEYQRGRAEGNLRSIERKMYGAELYDSWEMEREYRTMGEGS